MVPGSLIRLDVVSWPPGLVVRAADALERSLMCVGVFSVVSLYVEICVLSASQLDQILTWDNKPIIAAQ